MYKNIKVSYSCTNNTSKIIDDHNQKLMNNLDWNNNDKSKQSCNCKIKKKWPQRNKCNLNNIIHQANISTEENESNEKIYIGITNLNWKFRYNNHLQSFKNSACKDQTALSKYCWYLKKNKKKTRTNSNYELSNNLKIFLDKQLTG